MNSNRQQKRVNRPWLLFHRSKNTVLRSMLWLSRSLSLSLPTTTLLRSLCFPSVSRPPTGCVCAFACSEKCCFAVAETGRFQIESRPEKIVEKTRKSSKSRASDYTTPQTGSTRRHLFICATCRQTQQREDTDTD